MSDITDDLRKAAAQIAAAEHDGWGNTCSDAADEIDRLRVTVKMLMDDKAALQSARDVQDAALSVLRNDFRELANERDALREQMKHATPAPP